jgi:hypothetical protein
MCGSGTENSFGISNVTLTGFLAYQIESAFGPSKWVLVLMTYKIKELMSLSSYGQVKIQ